MLVDRFIGQGMTREEAASAACRQFGGIAHAKQDYYEVRRIPLFEEFFQDLRLAARMLRKSPTFTLTALVALVLGIGGNTAVFSVVNAILLKPLPYPAPGRIVMFMTNSPTGLNSSASPAKLNLWRQQTEAFQDVSAWRSNAVHVTSASGPVQVTSAQVTASFFRLFGLSILRGRAFTAEEVRPNGSRVAVLSNAFWMRYSGGDPQIIGKTIPLNGSPYVVVGIMGPEVETELFQLFDVWTPLPIDPNSADQNQYFIAAGRVKPGVALERAQSQLQRASEEYRRRFGGASGPQWGFRALPLRDFVAGDAGPAVLILAAAVSFVLLIACANFANLLLARSTSRRREMAIRLAIGAGRGRIIRQLLTESVLLSALGGVLGLAS
jgi:putative ABC transport system permease protein